MNRPGPLRAGGRPHRARGAVSLAGGLTRFGQQLGQSSGAWTRPAGKTSIIEVDLKAVRKGEDEPTCTSSPTTW